MSRSNNLHHIHSDALAEISSYLHFLDIANLWMCGNRLLTHKLANGGVKQVQLVFNTRHTVDFSWPRFISALRGLQSIEVANMTRYRACESVTISSEVLSPVSNGLRRLHLQSSDALVSLDDLLTQDASSLSRLEHLSIAHMGSGSADLMFTRATWPLISLVSLVFSVDDPNTLTASLDPSTLPPHLTSFIADVLSVNVNAHRGFPSTLHTLHLNALTFAEFNHLLPPTLAKLHITVRAHDATLLYEHELHALEFQTPLPSTLTSLRLPTLRYSALLLSQLPPTITEILHYGHATALDDIQLLPPMLRNSTCLLPCVIDADIARKLPKTITSTRRSVLPSAIPFIQHWTCYGIHYGLDYTNVTTDMSSFNMGIRSSRLDRIVFTFPSSVMTEVRNVMLAALPAKLRKLNVSETLNESQTSNLPRSLRSLIVTSFARARDCSLLPNLQKLVITTCTSYESDLPLRLPRSLKKLVIHFAGNNRIPPFTADWFSSLPPNITRLDLSGGISLSNASFADFWIVPSTLKMLYLRPKRCADLGMLRRLIQEVKLPTSLTDFQLLLDETDKHQTSSALTDTDIKHFLRRYSQLQRCYFINCANFDYDHDHYSDVDNSNLRREWQSWIPVTMMFFWVTRAAH